MQTTDVLLPPKLVDLFGGPRGSLQYRGAHGGRGSAKSRGFALMAAVHGYVEPMRILCVREFQNSISESFHAELAAAISMYPWLEDHYQIGRDYLRGRNGTEFIFRGLRRTSKGIKSLSGIDLTIAEESEEIPEESWLDLEATIFRQPKSELWAIWNPRLKDSPVDARFRQNPADGMKVVEMNHRDNPFFPVNMEKLRRREQQRLDPQTYAHVWEGDYLENSDSQVLAGKVRVSEFEAKENWDGPYFGADWGFAQDPTAAVRCWVSEETLYIDYEAGQVGLELDETAAYITAHIPGADTHTMRGDNARPETISYLKRHGLPRLIPVDKWSGSVEDGIGHLRSYQEIVIHPRCTETINETRLYSYKVDRLTGDVLPQVVDAYNHYIDALRYALGPLIQRRTATVGGLKVAGL